MRDTIPLGTTAAGAGEGGAPHGFMTHGIHLSSGTRLSIGVQCITIRGTGAPWHGTHGIGIHGTVRGEYMACGTGTALGACMAHMAAGVCGITVTTTGIIPDMAATSDMSTDTHLDHPRWTWVQEVGYTEA